MLFKDDGDRRVERRTERMLKDIEDEDEGEMMDSSPELRDDKDMIPHEQENESGADDEVDDVQNMIMMIAPTEKKGDIAIRRKESSENMKDMMHALSKEDIGGIKVEDVDGVGVKGSMREAWKRKGIVLDLTGRCEWDGKEWDLSDKKRAFAIDQVTAKNALLVITKDAIRSTET